MTTTQTIRNLKGAVSDAEDTINDLANQLDDAQGEVAAMTDTIASLEDRLRAAPTPGLRPEER